MAAVMRFSELCVYFLSFVTLSHGIHFQFHHKETLILSDDGFEDYEYDYGPGDVVDESLVRHRRDVKWAPDYDLYAQWADEYYAEADGSDNQPLGQRKGDLLDRLIDAAQPKSEEELELERKEEAQRKEILKSTIRIVVIIICSVSFCCLLSFAAKRLMKRFLCDFCDPYRLKDTLQQAAEGYELGVYVHEDGEKEQYTPTEEELEALKDFKRSLNTVF